MEVVEQFEMSKRGKDALSEDCIVVTEAFAAVIDGCSCRRNIEYDGHTPGYIASRLAGDVISSLNPTISANDAIQTINNAFQKWYISHNLFDEVEKKPEERIACYFSIFSRVRREVWVLGDTKALVETKLIANEKNVDRLHETLRSFLIRAEIKKGRSEDELLSIQESINAITQCISMNQPLFQNSSDSLFGYSAMDGFYQSFNNLEIYKVPEEVSEIVLSSDGYPRIFPTLTQSEEYLATLLESDPLCFKENLSVKGVMPGFNSYDDRSYLRLKI